MGRVRRSLVDRRHHPAPTQTLQAAGHRHPSPVPSHPRPRPPSPSSARSRPPAPASPSGIAPASSIGIASAPRPRNYPNSPASSASKSNPPTAATPRRATPRPTRPKPTGRCRYFLLNYRSVYHSKVPRTPARNQLLRSATRSRLLDAALLLFARDGFAGTSVKAIAVEASLATGLLYSHFPSQDALLLALFERGPADVQASLALAAADPAQRLPALIRGAAAIVRQHLPFWRLFYAVRPRSLRPLRLNRRPLRALRPLSARSPPRRGW
jgi:hypothetical protein